jgi:natural product precursor
MKNLGKLKLNQLSKANLKKREMSKVVGGRYCSCGCNYQGSGGGSSPMDNANANYWTGDNGATSYGNNTYCSGQNSNHWFAVR